MNSSHVIADFRVSSASEARIKLADAVTVAERAAFADRNHGVLVTRHSYNRFSVALSPAVPFGITIEHDYVRHGGRG